MIRVKPKACHGIVGELQVLPFPAFHAVAFDTVEPQRAFVRILRFVAGVTFEPRLAGLSQRRNS